MDIKICLCGCENNYSDSCSYIRRSMANLPVILSRFLLFDVSLSSLVLTPSSFVFRFRGNSCCSNCKNHNFINCLNWLGGLLSIVRSYWIGLIGGLRLFDDYIFCLNWQENGWLSGVFAIIFTETDMFVRFRFVMVLHTGWYQKMFQSGFCALEQKLKNCNLSQIPMVHHFKNCSYIFSTQLCFFVLEDQKWMRPKCLCKCKW